MSEEKGSERAKGGEIDPKAKFREALVKKRLASGIRHDKIIEGSKIKGNQKGRGTPKMFRRKSGDS